MNPGAAIAILAAILMLVTAFLFYRGTKSFRIFFVACAFFGCTWCVMRVSLILMACIVAGLAAYMSYKNRPRR